MVRLDTINIVGAGPAGLYSAILLKSARPDAQITVYEQNTADATFGFGVVFSEQALDFLQQDDPQTHALITPHMERWRNITLNHPQESLTIDGIGFSAIERLALLKILQQRALDVGVNVHFSHKAPDTDTLAEADLLIGADGLNSTVRGSKETIFQPHINYLHNRFAWFGTEAVFSELTQTFLQTDKGALNAHHYRYAPGKSTFIVECSPQSFANYGFAELDEQQSALVCEELFADVLQGKPLLINHSHWRQFPQLWCENWVAGNRVILGDAAHTAHFSIGSGTRLAMEDAISLVAALQNADTLENALQEYQQVRQPVARKIVDAANTSAAWYENFPEHMALAPLEFAYSYLTRSGRISHERLRKLSPELMARYEAAYS
ncbi:MAG: FAD-dependent monooxygenase [Thiolinea sp.]